jgi:hypothetical protein
MAWEIPLVGGLERHFCHEKRSSKKKVTCKLGESSVLALLFWEMKMAV